MSLRKIGIGAALAGALAVSGVALAQPPGEFMHGHMGGPGMEFLRAIDLSETQKAQVHDLMKSSWESTKPLMEKMRAAHEAAITALLGSGAVTADTLRPNVEQEAALRQQLDTIHLNTMLQLRSILTPEQLAQAAARHAQLEQLRTEEHSLMGAPE